MSAADKLRDLHEALGRAPWKHHSGFGGKPWISRPLSDGNKFVSNIGGFLSSENNESVVALRNALPDIIAVIAAAEKACELAGSNDETTETCHCSTCDTARALAALNARLTDTSDGGAA